MTEQEQKESRDAFERFALAENVSYEQLNDSEREVLDGLYIVWQAAWNASATPAQPETCSTHIQSGCILNVSPAQPDKAEVVGAEWHCGKSAHAEFYRIIALLMERLQKTTNHLRRNKLSQRLVTSGDAVRHQAIERLETLLGRLNQATLPQRDDTELTDTLTQCRDTLRLLQQGIETNITKTLKVVDAVLAKHGSKVGAA